MTAMLRHVPNLLTGLRLVAAPATAGLLVAGDFNAALGIFAFAGLSDVADGFLAKRFNLVTRLGRFLDPAADKALMLALFITLALLDDVPDWLAAAVIGRDLLIVLGVLVAVAARAPIAVRPLMVGKLCTALQIVYVGVHMAGLAFGFRLDGWSPADACVLATVTLASVAGYAVVWLKAMRARPGAHPFDRIREA
jgi:cardiolipin synthase